MKQSLLLVFMLLSCCVVRAQYTEPWTEPVQVTDSQSINSNPVILVLETETFLFYEKKFSEDGPSKIYYRDVKNMSSEMELLSDPVFSFRNPIIIQEFASTSDMYIFFESDQTGNFEIYGIPVDEFLNFGNTFQLTFTPEDENKMDYTTWYNQLVWDVSGEIRAAQVEFQDDTLFLQNTMTIDNQGCSNPKACNSRMVYQKTSTDSSAIYYADWEYTQSQWGSPVAIDTNGNNTYCHCSQEAWGYTYDDIIVYENEGNIRNYTYDEIYELDLPAFNNNMHEPHSIVYYLPVDNLPSPIFISFSSAALDVDDIYIYSVEFNNEPENLSNDTLLNSNPMLLWGGYGTDPCAMNLLDIWETHQNGFQPLYMSKCQLYVCGGLDDHENQRDIMQVSPNPFTNTLNIRFKSKSTAPVIIEVLNSTGNSIHYQQQGITEVGWNEYRLTPNQNTTKGLLYVKLSQGKKQLFRKVIYK